MNGIVLVFYYCIGKKKQHILASLRKAEQNIFVPSGLATGVFEELPKAYKMKWDPVLKKSKRHLQCHVGRLLEDDRIKISPKFSADFPEYSGDDWFWGANKKNCSRSRISTRFSCHSRPCTGR